MKKVIRLTESDLVRIVKRVINEIDIENSYINNYKDENQYKNKNINVFNNSTTSEFIDYGIQFMESGKGMYQVLFMNKMPDEFYNFIEKNNDDVKSEIFDSLNRIYIESSGAFNRIHFREGIHPYLKGIGFGYIIYEAFIKYLGFASSSESATSDARKIWKKLLNDPDFHGIVCGDNNKGEVLIFSKTYNGDVLNISKNFLSNKCMGDANIDDSLMNMFPDITY
jgi:hypothetical protein